MAHSPKLDFDSPADCEEGSRRPTDFSAVNSLEVREHMDVGSVIATFLSTATVASVVAFLARSALGQFLRKDLEVYRERLKFESARELEGLRVDLERVALEHRVRFTQLQERRAEIISAVFANDKVHRTFRWWTSRGGPRTSERHIREREKEAAEAFGAFTEHYWTHAIWLAEDTCRLLDQVVDTFHDAYIDMTLFTESKRLPEDRDDWRSARDTVLREIPPARTALDRRFRELLGVSGLGASAVAPAEPAGSVSLR